MPMLTREMIVQQQMTRNAARLSTPSTPSSRPYSPTPSLSSSPASTTSSLSRSSGRSSQIHTPPDRCWIPSLDEVSRADPNERARLFARLALEAEHDAQYATPRTPERKARTFTSGHLPAKSSDYSTEVIGAGAFQFGHPSKGRSIERPTDSAPGTSALEAAERMAIEDQQIFSEWVVDIPDSPVTSSFRMNYGTVSEEVIAGWNREDVEMEILEREAQNDRLRKLGYSI